MALPFEQLEFSSLEDVCAKIGGNWPSASHQGRFLNFVNVFSLFRYFPWEKGVALLWKKTRISFTKRCFVPSLVENGHVVLESKIFKFCQCIFDISLFPLGKGQALHLN